MHWMKECAAITGRVNDVAAQFGQVRFVHVETDAIRWTKHQEAINRVSGFPTFVVYQKNKVLSTLRPVDTGANSTFTFGNSQAAEKVVEAISTALQQTLTATDRKIYRLQQSREEEERRALHDPEDDAEEAVEIPWVWDEEHRGERITFDNQVRCWYSSPLRHGCH